MSLVGHKASRKLRKEGESVNHSFRFILREDLALYKTKTPVEVHSAPIHQVTMS